jgi:hypothetical protein
MYLYQLESEEVGDGTEMQAAAGQLKGFLQHRTRGLTVLGSGL